MIFKWKKLSLKAHVVKGDRELFFFQANATASLLLWSFTISTRRSKLKSYKNPDQFKVAHNITQTGPRNQDKITTNNKIFLLLYPNKSWQ